ncbi:MAG: peptidylprolyl isomerase [Spirochaetales bacterium]|nr:peptidylprolyl isomerase [Spirochaetales bacterium]
MKKNLKMTLFFLTILSIASCKKTPNIKENGMFAVFNTNMGSFTCQLFYDKVPVTVGNFVALAEGNMEFTDPKTNDKIKKKYYDGLIFHRIIDSFMIQGGDILGTGYGGPGYSFIDEFDSSLKHDSEGILSMANAGPDTNGSQFFITLVPTPHLDGRHTVFGKVVDGMDVVREIGKVKVDQNDRPFKEVFIKNIEIVRKGDEAKNFDAVAAFGKQEEILKKRATENEVKKAALLKNLGCDSIEMKKTSSGMEYYIIKEGSGKQPTKGKIITAHYAGYFLDGSKFDSSYDRNEPFNVNIGVGRVIPGWDEALLDMKEGEKRIIVLPYYLAYGERGYGPIPPKATLVFEVELLKTE